MVTIRCLLAYCLLQLLLIGKIEGCRNTCGAGAQIGENLRGHFSSCMKNKTNGGFNWEYIVNYVVWDDVWYLAASTFYCRDKSTDCWITQADQFLKPTSPYRKPFKECIMEYSPSNITNSTVKAPETTPTCEKPEASVYLPIILNSFTTIKECPRSKYSYISCLVSAALAVTRSARVTSEDPKFLPRYNFIELKKFILQHRSDCRITQLRGSNSYITRCPSPPPRIVISQPKPTQTTPKPKSGSGIIVRGKRALTLAELMAQLAGGQLNIRLSSSGQARILPSGPLTQKITTPFECFGLKLQSLLRSRSVLSSATSKCNHDIVSKPPVTHRVSTSFRVASAPKKEPGMVGKCGRDDEWTAWYNHDAPNRGPGDLEYFSRIRSRNQRHVCFRPSAVQALLAADGRPYTAAFQKVTISPMLGLSCYNYQQRKKKCADYKVRFCCPIITPYS